jgi:hypothetical protein
MGTQIGANPLQVLQRVPNDGLVLLQNCNEPPSLTLCQLVADDDWRGSIVVKKGVLQSRRQRVVEQPKRLGPGALISVAKQLGPKSACTGSSSSEASIKATLFQDRADNTHTKVSPEITTQNISYMSE